MFTWICPVCGREVPPSYTECPTCAETNKTPAVSQTPVIKPDEPPPVPRAPYLRLQDQPAATPTPRGGMPTWLMSIVFALAFGGVVAGAYFGVQYLKKEPAPETPAPAAESKPAAAAPAAPGKTNPILKHLEIGGVRLTQNSAGKTEVRFLVINHSGAEIADLAGTVGLQARTSKKDEEPVGAFAFKIPVLGPYESKESSAIVDTKLKVYELPDWQNLDLRVQVTSPQ
jgi:hypothetical protein